MNIMIEVGHDSRSNAVCSGLAAVWQPFGSQPTRALRWPARAKWLAGLAFKPLLGVRGLDMRPAKKTYSCQTGVQPVGDRFRRTASATIQSEQTGAVSG